MGTILGIAHKRAIIQTNDSKPNRNILVVGGPGSYKTQSMVITNVLFEQQNSIVLTDPKGEVYEMTAAIKAAQGYEVHVINYTNMRASDRHNPLDYVRYDRDANIVANKIIETSNKDAKRDIWFLSQRALLKALILYAVHELSPEKRTLGGIIEFLQLHSADSKALDQQFEQLPLEHPARKTYELGYKKAKGEVQASIIISLLSTIAEYIDEDVNRFTSFSDFHLQDVGRKKMILYIIMPLMDSTWQGLINIFFQQLFTQLYELAATNHAKLPNEVTFILDEFANLGHFEHYEEFLATCRGYGIGVMTIVQTITQLQDKYKDKKAESILGNCAVKICLNAANETTAKYFSNLMGDATVKVATQGKSKNRGSDKSSSSMSDNESYTRRPLMTPQEIAMMKNDTSIILLANKPPIRAKKAMQFALFPKLIDNPKWKRLQHLYKNESTPQQLAQLQQRQRQFEDEQQKKQHARELELQHQAENIQSFFHKHDETKKEVQQEENILSYLKQEP
ncbi:MAG: type IV secretory system conjugative DNA transfer family protein [Caryophanon sp.]|nr:type IV secretory system conjugative DNA transfer family protein [Caryophanon sp.]